MNLKDKMVARIQNKYHECELNPEYPINFITSLYIII